MVSLEKAWSKVSHEPEAKLAFETWQKYLTVTYGKLAESSTPKKVPESGAEISELESLFLRHTYLSSLARLLIWASLSRGKTKDSLRQVAKEVLTGSYFRSKKLANLVDDDFFHWVRNDRAESLLAGPWERILSHFLDYDLSLMNKDVLKGVYQQLIDPKDRHDLGEYYTPDWLCERMVMELLPKQGFKSVLDPTCGSGSFLRASITHYIDSNPNVDDGQKLKNILANVNGIDIHPVAVTISRATYVLALGSLIKKATKPIQIPVYLADSLFLPTEVEANLLDRLSGIEVTFGQRKSQRTVVMPHTLVHSPELFDEAIAACTAVAEDHARTGKDTRASLARHLEKAVPQLSQMLEREEITDALWDFSSGLAEMIRDRRNSIWSFIVRNSYRPAMFRQQFDIIIGNPPWLSYRYIADPEYQQEIKRRAVSRYKIAPKKWSLFTQMELGTVVLAHSMAVFARANARLGFVLPRSILSSDQHAKLILREYDAPFRLTAYWDLWDVNPLFNVPACVLFATRDTLHGSRKDVLPAKVWSGRLPERDVDWRVAKKRLEKEDCEGRIIYLGSRSALSTANGALSPTKPSKYKAIFKNGATIYPRSFFFVDIQDLDGDVDPEEQYWVQTDSEQAASSQPPYDEINMKGLADGRFIFTTALAKHILPFVVLPPARIVLPVLTKGGSLRVVTSSNLIHEGYREFGRWVKEAEDKWLELRENKAGKMSLEGNLDYQGKLTAQVLTKRHLVLYTASGTNVSAAHFDRHSQKLPFVVDHKSYRAEVPDPREADYLAAILNSEAANVAIKPFQSTGLLGERDIHKKLLDLPIPLFDPSREDHLRLAELGEEGRIQATTAIKVSEFPASLARQRSFVREAVLDILSGIDKIVRKLI